MHVKLKLYFSCPTLQHNNANIVEKRHKFTAQQNSPCGTLVCHGTGRLRNTRLRCHNDALHFCSGSTASMYMLNVLFQIHYDTNTQRH